MGGICCCVCVSACVCPQAGVPQVVFVHCVCSAHMCVQGVIKLNIESEYNLTFLLWPCIDLL